MWLRLGNKRFKNMREVLLLPSDRTLQLYRTKMPTNGGGFHVSVFESLLKQIESQPGPRSVEDYDVILSWDATGYNRTLRFDKHSGSLLGFDCDPESFCMHNMFSSCVNCFMVTSPQRDIHIKFPVAYYHCAGLNSAKIRRQCGEVMAGLDNIGLRVVALVCDGASEHARYFNLTLEEFAANDDSIKVMKDGMWAISDPPHLVKKFRNNWLTSGEKDRHTRRLDKDGFHIGWTVMEAVHTISTTLPTGDVRPFTLLRKVTWDVVQPSPIQTLRVSLAAIPFSKEVRDFVSSNLDRLVRETGLRHGDIRLTLEYMGIVDEVFQIMNSKYPVTWSPEDDGTGTGTPIGLRDRCDTSKGHNLSFFAKIFGVSVQYMMEISGLPSPNSVPNPDHIILVDRPQRLLKIASYFKEWKTYVDGLPNLTKKERSKLFITHWLFDDLRRTCHGVVGLLKTYITPGCKRCWVLRRLNQDPIESLFGQIRNYSGSNKNMDRTSVDLSMCKIRCMGMESFM